MSRFYGGRITDNQMVTDCGVIEKVEPDDEFMADKGFPKVKFICSKKATKFCEIFTLLLSYLVPVNSKVKI